MKYFITLISVLGLWTTQASGQITIGAKAGASPSVNPGTRFIIVNRQDPSSEFLFNAEHVHFDGQIGLVARYDMKPWWFSIEALAGRQTTEYSVFYGQDRIHAGAPLRISEQRLFLDIPLSAGVKLGWIDVFSGFNLSHSLKTTSGLAAINGYSRQKNFFNPAWHTGVGANLGWFSIDVRYQQAFSNYGAGHFVNGQELILRNAPGRIVAMIGFRL
jgi:hypothetical protein